MEKGVTYDYDPSTKTLKKAGGSTKGFTPRQRKTAEENRKKDKTGSDPFWPIHT
jgi:hypothetical protein